MSRLLFNFARRESPRCLAEFRRPPRQIGGLADNLIGLPKHAEAAHVRIIESDQHLPRLDLRIRQRFETVRTRPHGRRLVSRSTSALTE